MQIISYKIASVQILVWNLIVKIERHHTITIAVSNMLSQKDYVNFNYCQMFLNLNTKILP